MQQPTEFIKFPLLPVLYVSREQEDVIKNDVLKNSSRSVIELVGEQAVGKSSLANAVVHNICQESPGRYQWVGWINCLDENQFHQSIIAIAKKCGNQNHQFKEALFYFKGYCSDKSGWLLVIDGFSTQLNNIVQQDAQKTSDLSIAFLDNFIKEAEGDIIYTTTQSVKKHLSSSSMITSRTIEHMDLSEVTAFVNKHFSSEQWKQEDFKVIFEQTQGLPLVLSALCEEYKQTNQYENFMKFMASKGNIQSADYLQKHFQKTIDDLNLAAKTDQLASKALLILKQIAYLGSAAIPFGFFSEDNKGTYNTALDKLCKTTALIECDKFLQTLRLPVSCGKAIQFICSKESDKIIEMNLKRLHALFNCLVINDYTKKVDQLAPYVSHVSDLLDYFKTIPLPQILQASYFRKLVELCCSLGRFYYRFEGNLKQALVCLEQGQKWLEHKIPTTLANSYSQAPDIFQQDKNPGSPRFCVAE